ncbi:ABC transporter ATP-binding protein [Parasalinivibrio latis]|uniref:ABC transporter ATP-binding protein n=1 Tax=Parasalinivibrio latis TaxID=2952610 RepID=UPI0030E3875A
MIEVIAISKHFKNHRVLDGINLRVEGGETIALFGPSGSGKTLLLRLIAGVEMPTEGDVYLRGNNVTDSGPEARGIGMAFQNFALFPHMNAFDNIASAIVGSGMSEGQVKARVLEVAQLLKIDQVLSHTPRALSNGQKQRTALARALAAKPDILLLDDPLRNVDAKLRFEMRLELPQLLAKQKASVIYVTQDYKEAMALGDRIAVLGSEGLVQLGTPEEIYLSPNNLDIATAFGDPSINTFAVGPLWQGGQWKINVGGLSLSLPINTHPEALHTGGSYVAGIRPEHLALSDQPGSGKLAMEVKAVTPVNEKTVVLMEGEDQLELVASIPSHQPSPARGSRIWVTVPTEQILLFEEASGLRVVTGGPELEGACA